MSNSSSKGTALITGASRGIGAVYADRRTSSPRLSTDSQRTHLRVRIARRLERSC
jgi:short-subunit dehydrogenase